MYTIHWFTGYNGGIVGEYEIVTDKDSLTEICNLILSSIQQNSDFNINIYRSGHRCNKYGEYYPNKIGKSSNPQDVVLTPVSTIGVDEI
jgi:hypothetical protein